MVKHHVVRYLFISISASHHQRRVSAVRVVLVVLRTASSPPPLFAQFAARSSRGHADACGLLLSSRSVLVRAPLVGSADRRASKWMFSHQIKTGKPLLSAWEDLICSDKRSRAAQLTRSNQHPNAAKWNQQQKTVSFKKGTFPFWAEEFCCVCGDLTFILHGATFSSIII